MHPAGRRKKALSAHVSGRNWLCRVCLTAHQEKLAIWAVLGCIVMLLSRHAHLHNFWDVQDSHICFPQKSFQHVSKRNCSSATMKKTSRYGPHLVASFHARAPTRTCKNLGRLRTATLLRARVLRLRRNSSRAQREKKSAAPLFRCFTFPRSRLVLVPSGKSNIRETFPALGLQVQFHQTPTQEKRLAWGHVRRCQHRSGAQFFGRLRQRGPGPDLSLGACLSRLKQRRPLTSALGTRAAMNFSSRRTIRASRLLRSRLRLCDC